jgi:hypothetical protein
LHRLKAGDTFKAKIVQNSHFHFPKNSPEVIMICNGTGIEHFKILAKIINKFLVICMQGSEINLRSVYINLSWTVQSTKEIEYPCRCFVT